MQVFLNDAMPTMHNVMMDLETWGTAAGSALRSIGAVEFDPHSDKIGDTFYMNISSSSCEECGLTRDRSTVDWWAGQSQQAQDALNVDPRHVGEVMNEFHEWFRRRGMFVWSHGSNFDEPLWTNACRVVDRSYRLRRCGKRMRDGTQTIWPWFFWDARCTRTAYDVTGFNPKSIKRVGTHHNALDDAIHQARCVQAAYARRAG